MLSFLKGQSSARDKSPLRPWSKFEVDTVKYTPGSGERDVGDDSGRLF